MKLRNKKTGDIIIPSDYTFATYDDGIRYGRHTYYSLAELNEEWEDYEEPKGTYFINTQGDVQFWDSSSFAYPNDWTKEKEIGNYFETKEEAEKAVEKLKAWKRLKDKGFRFNGGDDACISYLLDPVKWDDELEKDFDLLFGGEE